MTDEQYAFIEEKIADSDRFDSKSEVVRHVFEEYERLHNELTTLQEEHENELDRLQAEMEKLEQELERLENEKRTLINSRQEHTELVEYVEEQRELTHYQERRQRLLDDANILRRWKWRLTGVPVEEPSSDE